MIKLSSKKIPKPEDKIRFKNPSRKGDEFLEHIESSYNELLRNLEKAQFNKDNLSMEQLEEIKFLKKCKALHEKTQA